MTTPGRVPTARPAVPGTMSAAATMPDAPPSGMAAHGTPRRRRLGRLLGPRSAPATWLATGLGAIFLLAVVAEGWDLGLILECLVAGLLLAAVLPVAVWAPWGAALLVVLGCLAWCGIGLSHSEMDASSLTAFLCLAVFTVVCVLPGQRARHAAALGLVLTAAIVASAALATTPYFAEPLHEIALELEAVDSMTSAIGGSRRSTWPVAFLLGLGLFIVPALLAWLLRTVMAMVRARTRTKAALRQIRELQLQQRVSDDRTAIAHDVHDILAHSLTVILAQSQAAALVQGPQQVEALNTVTRVARTSLGDVRSLIERLDSNRNGMQEPDAAAPSLTNVPALLSTFRSAGLAVSTETLGEPRDLGPGVGVAAYRVIQEALTNALKHGDREGPTRLVVDWRGDPSAVCLTVTSPLRPGPAGEQRGPAAGELAAAADQRGPAGSEPALAASDLGSTGRGLESMRIRTAVAGGWMSAGPCDDAFSVVVTLPTPDIAVEPAA
jgi:signal transduction histidine kinase